MTTFAIISPTANQPLGAAIRTLFSRNLEFSPGQFVISVPAMTAQQVSNLLGADGKVGKFVVFSVFAHWGYHDKSLWEWLTVNGS